MKKKYSKPDLHFERLEVQAAISTACSYKADENGKPLPYGVGGGVNLFLSDNVDCTLYPENMGIEVCYHGFDETHNVFQS